MVFAKSLKGTDGRITYPALGALIAETFAWQLYSEDMKSYTLNARCKYVVDALWDEVDHRKKLIELRISKDVWVVARLVEGAEITRRSEREILVKGVVLEKKES